MLPYFAGERTPIMDPRARGVLAGLTLLHTAGDLYRAALEATGYAVRHNVEVMTAAGGDVRRVVAVGGGTKGSLWTQIVSDITGLTQVIPTQTVGASYGSAFLAASLNSPVAIEDWNPPLELREPNPNLADRYEQLYRSYRDLYLRTADVVHDLAALQEHDSMHQPAPAEGAAS
jgi:xylulokinase